MAVHEASLIDTKLDDHKPDTGNVGTMEAQGSISAGSGCDNQNPSNRVVPASSYDMTNVSPTACSLVFNTGM
ncbi:MAG: hypothetical protein ACOYNL_05190 [Rickettsiales bacterium]